MTLRTPLALLLLVSVAAAQQAKPVTVAPVVEREVAEGKTFVGTAVPSRHTTVGSAVEELVVEFLVREGDRVEQGQPLARLRTTVVDDLLLAARAQLDLRKEELAELENGSRPQEIAEARARLGQAQADLDLREWKLAAAQRLFENGTVTEDELQEARLTAAGAKERLNEAAEALKLVEEGPRKERIAQARAGVAVAQAEVKRLEDDLARHTIAAPFAGYVVAEHTEVGEWMDKGGAVAEIAALDEIDVRVQVLEDYVGGLSVGLDAVVSFGAIPGEAFTGVVKRIVPNADVRARTFPVEVRLKNRPENGGVLVKAGMFARVTLAVGQKKRALLVPKDAIVLGGQPAVFVVEDGAAKQVPVRLGVAEGALIEVIGDVAAGAQVVTRGNERLRTGVPVRVAE